MGLRERLFGAPERSLTTSVVMFDGQRRDAILPIVGESYRQDALERYVRIRNEQGVTHGNLTAVLVPEPSNAHDRNAIKVLLVDADANAAHVGYLSREDAKSYGPVVRHVSPRLIQARARLIGGWDDPLRGRGSIGVLLNLGTPSELAGELLAGEEWRVPAHRWAGRTVCFTGPSVFGFGGVRLDRATQEMLAARAGCKSWPRLTKQVDAVIVGSPSSVTAKLDKAREYGTEMVREEEFWTALGLRLDPW